MLDGVHAWEVGIGGDHSLGTSPVAIARPQGGYRCGYIYIAAGGAHDRVGAWSGGVGLADDRVVRGS